MSCLLCNTEPHLFNACGTHTLYQCPNCALVFQEDRTGAHNNVYNESWVEARRLATDKVLTDHALFNINLVTSYTNRPGSLLEIGCGTGEFLYLAKMAGWDTVGVEPSPEAAEYCAVQYGLDVINHPWEKTEGGFPHNVICFFHTLEHSTDPVQFLRKVATNLKSDGWVFFSVPNLHSFTNQKQGKDSPLFTEADHFWHFNTEHLKQLLALSGLKPISIFSRECLTALENDITTSGMTLTQKLAKAMQLQAGGVGHEMVAVAQKAD